MNFEDMWNDYILKNPEYKDEDYSAWSFLDNDSLEKTLLGSKKGISSLYDSFVLNHEPIPCKGDFNIILDNNDEAMCITRTTKVTLMPFGDIDVNFAKLENIFDGSLKAFKDAKRDEFMEELKLNGKTLDKETVLVLEEFEVVYKREAK